MRRIPGFDLLNTLIPACAVCSSERVAFRHSTLDYICEDCGGVSTPESAGRLAKR